MSDQATAREYGFLLYDEMTYGTHHLGARIVCRESNTSHPRGISHEYGQTMELDGLCLQGFVNQYKDEAQTFLGCDKPEYRDVFSIDAGKAKRMAFTLAKIEKRIESDGARTPAECFLAMARALKLSFVVEKTKALKARNFGHSYADSDWDWRDVADGKNLFAYRIAEALKPKLVEDAA